MRAAVTYAAIARRRREPRDSERQSSRRSYGGETSQRGRSSQAGRRSPDSRPSVGNSMATARSALVSFPNTGTVRSGVLECHAVHASVEFEHERGLSQTRSAWTNHSDRCRQCWDARVHHATMPTETGRVGIDAYAGVPIVVQLAAFCGECGG